MKTTLGWLLAVSLAFVLPTAHGGDALPESAATHPESSDAARLIRQLDAPQFAERQAASRKLTEAGTAVFPDVEQAAQTGSREVASRAVEILRSHFQGGDDATKQAAKASLERLAKGSNPVASQRASDALNPRPEQALAGNINGINPALIQLMQRQAIQQQAAQQAMRLQMPGQMINPAPGRFVRRTSMRTINGQREIEVQDGNKITKVRDVAGGGIEGEITDKTNGKETTRKVAAKNLEDLKAKDAELANLYERYQPRPVTPDTIKRQIESLDRLQERIKADLPNNPGAQRSLDSLQRTRQQYEERLKEAEKAAGQAPPAAPANAERAAGHAAQETARAAQEASRAAEVAGRQGGSSP